MKILHFCWTTLGNKITYWKKWPSRLRVKWTATWAADIIKQDHKVSLTLGCCYGENAFNPVSAFIKPDQLDPWIKDQIGNTLLSTILHLQLQNFVSCGRDKPCRQESDFYLILDPWIKLIWFDKSRAWFRLWHGDISIYLRSFVEKPFWCIFISYLQYIPRNMHTVLLCFALLWLCNRS